VPPLPFALRVVEVARPSIDYLSRTSDRNAEDAMKRAPAATNTIDDGRGMNRRVELVSR
jgi:hypothetical protein